MPFLSQANFDIIGLLAHAQRHGANQLADFCLHFIASNYQPMSKRAEFKTLSAENLAYVTKHQWPPVSYLKEVQKYKEAMESQGKNCIIQ